jgi:hypothetical protein
MAPLLRVCDSRVCDTFLVMTERSFVTLRYDGNVPAMACCGKCQHKFFTPTDFRPDGAGAEQYLPIVPEIGGFCYATVRDGSI